MMYRAALVLWLLAVLPDARAAGVMEALTPAETLDALQRVQDAIAAGDAGALPLQTELIALMDKSFAASLNAQRGEEAQPQFFLAFALAGGNRMTFSAYIKRAHLEADNKELAGAISAYIEGDVDKAQAQFDKVEARTLHLRLAPLVAFAKGTANIRKSPAIALRNFDIARLMAPGTLIEEAALRRTISMHAANQNAGPFLKDSEQYARRFIRSPYATQFAEAFVTGAVGMADTLTEQSIAGVLDSLPADRKTALCLRLTRKAMITGRLPLAAFAAAEALKDGTLAQDSARRAQIELYSIIPDLTKEDDSQLKARLAAIDAARLPAEDQPLLKAALQIVEAIAEPFEGVEAITKPASAKDKALADTTSTAAQTDPIDDAIAANREKLAAVDALLESAR
jgi:chemotaxis protein MotC